MEQASGGKHPQARRLLRTVGIASLVSWVTVEFLSVLAFDWEALRHYAQGQIVAAIWSFLTASVLGFIHALLAAIGWPLLVMYFVCEVASNWVSREPPNRLGLALLLVGWMAALHFEPFQWLPYTIWAYVALSAAMAAVTIALSYSVFVVGSIGLRILAVLTGLTGAAILVLMVGAAVSAPSSFRASVVGRSLLSPHQVMAVLGRAGSAESVRTSKSGEILDTSSGCNIADTYCSVVLLGWTGDQVARRLGIAQLQWQQFQMGNGMMGRQVIVNGRVVVSLVQGSSGTGVTAAEIGPDTPSRLKVPLPPK